MSSNDPTIASELINHVHIARGQNAQLPWILVEKLAKTIATFAVIHEKAAAGDFLGSDVYLEEAKLWASDPDVRAFVSVTLRIINGESV